MKFLVTLLFAFLFAGCAPKPEPVLDQATVVAKNPSLRLRNSSTSRTLRVLDTGEKVEVLERQENWYRVRYGSDVQGWMEESTVVTNDTKNRIQQLVAASNFHTERPNRILATIDRQFLARRIRLAWAPAWVAAHRRVLLDFFHARNLSYRDRSDLAAWAIDCVSAAESLAGFVERQRFGIAACGPVDRV